MAAFASIPLILYADFLTNSKLGMVGALAASSFFLLMAAFRYWRRNKNSLIAASVFFFYPASIGLVGLIMAASHRFYILVMGDRSHAASTQARIEQMHVGLEKFLHWPFGYGIGQAAVTISIRPILSRLIRIFCPYLLSMGYWASSHTTAFS